jgi:hypothetical protein
MAHLLNCLDCQEEVAGLSAVASRLVDLVPGTEPPLGFDRAVLVRVGLRRRKHPVALAVAAVVVMAALLTGSLLTAAGGSHHAVASSSPIGVFRDDGIAVGSLSVSGRPSWVYVRVRGIDVSGPVSCQMVEADGSVETLGVFDLVHGSGYWAAPHPEGVREYRGARLVDLAGQIVATATWH